MSERIALAFEEREYSLPELDALANGMATVLEQRGVRPGERVALMSSNRPEFVIALQAIWRLGASASCSARRGSGAKSSMRWR